MPMPLIFPKTDRLGVGVDLAHASIGALSLGAGIPLVGPGGIGSDHVSHNMALHDCDVSSHYPHARPYILQIGYQPPGKLVGPRGQKGVVNQCNEETSAS